MPRFRSLMLSMLALGAVIGALAVTPSLRDGAGDRQPPTEADAVQLAERIAAVATSSRPQDVCDWATRPGHCREMIEHVPALPADGAEVRCAFAGAGVGDQPPVTVVRLEGHDSHGRAYEGDLVFNGTVDGPRVSTPMFWAGATYEPHTPPASDDAVPVACPRS